MTEMVDITEQAVDTAWGMIEPRLTDMRDKLDAYDLGAGWIKWRIGRVLHENFGNERGGLGGYGDKIADKAAAFFHRKDSREIYEWVRVAQVLPTEADVIGRLGKRFTWSDAVKTLPSVGKDAARSGGKKKQLDRLSFLNEWNLEQTREAIRDIEVDQRQEVIGHLIHVVTEGFDLLRELDTQAAVEVDTQNVDVSAHLHHWVPGSELSPQQMTAGQVNAVQEMVRLFPCVFCGTEYDITFHHWIHTKGAGGKDWRGLPACSECHAMVQGRDYDELMDEYEQQIVEWLQDSLAMAMYAASEVRR